MKAISRLFVLFCFVVGALCAPGEDDPTFQATVSNDYDFIVPVSDGMVVADWGGQVLKLDLQGAPAANFTPALQGNTYIYALTADTQERLLVGIGAGSANTGSVIRLLADGSQDSNFTIVATDNRVTAIRELPGSEILIAGHFKQVNGQPRAGLARVSATGALDANFAPAEGRVPEVLGLTADGDYLVSDVGSLRRYSPDGTYKSWVQYGESISFFGTALLPTPDGGTWIDAAFESAQLLADGAVDISYSNGIWPEVAAIMPDGRILIYGYDSGYRGNRLALLYADGSEDRGFLVNSNEIVTAIAPGPNNTAYLSGSMMNLGGYFLKRVFLYDESTPARIQFNRQRASVGESNSIPLILIRDGDSSESASVRISTSAGMAMPGGDYLETNTVVQFAPGERTNRVSIATSGDAQMRSAREFQVSLSDVQGAVIGNNTNVTVTILDRQSAVMGGGTTRAFIENGGRGQISIGRSGSVAYPRRLLWKLEPHDPNDTNAFVAMEGETQFAALDGNAFIDFRLLDDTVVSSNRLFTLTFSTPDPTLELSRSNDVLVMIIENDRPNDPGRGVDDLITDAEFYPDGRLAIAGNFLSVNGSRRPKVARLLPTGEIDGGFIPPEFGSNASINAIAPLPEGKLAVLGNFTNVAGLARKYVVRLKENGSLDEAFDASASMPWQPSSMAATVEGKILVLGGGHEFNGVNTSTNNGLITRTNLGSVVLLEETGAKNMDFATATMNGAGGHIATLPDGRFVIAGDVRVYRDLVRNTSNPGQILRQYVARFHADGKLDTNFTAVLQPTNIVTSATASQLVRSLSLAPDGDVLVTGNFMRANNAAVRSLVRLNADGSTDQPFTSNATKVITITEQFANAVLSTNGRAHLVVTDRNNRYGYGYVAQEDGTRDVSFGSMFDFSLNAAKSFWAAGSDGTAVLANNYQRLLWYYPTGTTAVNANLGLSSPQIDENDVLRLRVEVRTTGTLVIEESSDFVQWSEVLTQQAAAGIQTIVMPGEATGARFFRAFLR